MSILVINAGSSSLKFALYPSGGETELATGLVDWTDPARGAEFVVQTAEGRERRSPFGSSDHRSATSLAIRSLFETESPAVGRLADVEAVGHRVVHGGSTFRESVLIDRSVMDELRRLSELAPLHNPPALEAIEHAQEVLPAILHVAVFDTSYYAHVPEFRVTYPVPYDWTVDWDVRKFGFHGISHAYLASRAAEMLVETGSKAMRVVSCHLGNGCSATASVGGKAVQTTMGYTPLDGLMMGSRCGSIDPGVILHLIRKKGLTADEVDQALNFRSGLKGVSGVSNDYRAVSQAAAAGNERAKLALAIYADRVRSAVGALAVSMGGIDALVFSAGVGEHSSSLRAEVCRGLECLGVKIDPQANADLHPDADLSGDGRVKVLTIATREDRMIARETRAMIHL
ncbi:MAG TPA: acetate/propionate family kinase [Isosphaeraceae bacterium]|nr:acetate/propionate family kinase [Isosphaeraceae bacterium]